MLLTDDLFPPVEADAGRREGGVMRQEFPARADLEHYRKAAKDGANAVRLGKHPGWLDAAVTAVEEFLLNVSRGGVVFVGTAYPSWVEPLAARTAEASLAAYEAIRELDD
jgi:hypothetical protein